MKPITQTKTTTKDTSKMAALPRDNGEATAPVRAKAPQAQCCAKTSKVTMGCHD
jgi:hypothetical protein